MSDEDLTMQTDWTDCTPENPCDPNDPCNPCCDIGELNKYRSSSDTLSKKSSNTWYCSSQRMQSRIESDGTYTVTIKYKMNTDREFTENTQFDRNTPYLSPMYYQPNPKGSRATIDGTAVFLDTIQCTPISEVQYELTEIWKTPPSEDEKQSPNNLKNWNISISFVRSKYSISDYNGAPATNTAGDPIDVPVMIQVIDISGKYRKNSTGQTGSGVNASPMTLLGINIPKHCGLITRTYSTAPDGDGYDIMYKCSVSYDTRQLGDNEYIIGSESKTVGGWDVLVPNMGWNKLSRASDEKVRAAVVDVMSGIARETPDKVMLDTSGYEVKDNKKYYLKFNPYPEVNLLP